METYTFIAEFQGGTYVSQAKGASINEACIIWGKSLVQNVNITLKNKASFVKTLQNDLEEMSPACLEDTPNVWYFLADTGKGYIHVNVVKTHPAVADWQPRSKGVLVSDAASGVAAGV